MSFQKHVLWHRVGADNDFCSFHTRERRGMSTVEETQRYVL